MSVLEERSYGCINPYKGYRIIVIDTIEDRTRIVVMSGGLERMHELSHTEMEYLGNLMLSG